MTLLSVQDGSGALTAIKFEIFDSPRPKHSRVL